MDMEYILLPARGLKAKWDPNATSNLAFDTLLSVQQARSTEPPVTLNLPGARPIEVLDSINENGPKLVRADQEAALAARALGLRLAPVIKYQAAGRFTVQAPPGAGSGPLLHVSVRCKSTRTPIAGAIVTAFTSFANREGAEAKTDPAGECDLDLGKIPITLDRLYVQPPLAGYWGGYQTGVTCSGTYQIELVPVQAAFIDALAYFYGHTAKLSEGEGVIVGVVDTGVDNTHPALKHVIQGENTAKGEPRTLWQDNGTGHGTHVAGIIGSRGAMRTGLAPGADLRSYRAFPQGSLETTNYQILKALMRAMDAQCHIINLSLSSEDRPDDTLRDALIDCKDRGILVTVAAGNEGRPQVGYPALYAFGEGLSVSAMGRNGTYPAGSYEESDIGSVFGASDPDDFAARFTNTGDVSLVAPGVGIISTVPGGDYGVMSGTSMACPAVSGMAARLFAADLAANGSNAILRQPPNANRTVKMIQLLSSKAKKRFNDPKVEGDGMIPR